jgi:hypothetical protein
MICSSFSLLGQIGNLTSIHGETALIGSSTFLACPGAGVLDENPSHRAGSGGEEKAAAVPGEFDNKRGENDPRGGVTRTPVAASGPDAPLQRRAV